MNKQIRIIVCIVMAAAIALIVVCFSEYTNLGGELYSCEQQLSESRLRWEGIAEEKETLQVNLKIKENDLKEARLSLEEATRKTAELKEEIEQLRQEIESMKQSGPDSQ